MDLITVGLTGAGLVAGLVVGLRVKKTSDGKKIKSAEEQAQTILAKAKEHLSTSENELPEILVWESSFLSLTEDQKSLCVALHRNMDPMYENKLASYLDCSVETLRDTQVGIWGILIDGSTRKYWIK